MEFYVNGNIIARKQLDCSLSLGGRGRGEGGTRFEQLLGSSPWLFHTPSMIQVGKEVKNLLSG